MKVLILNRFVLLFLVLLLVNYHVTAQAGLVYGNTQLSHAALTDASKEGSYDQVLPLAGGFAHNDYLHLHPLYDALGNGFTNIEADVFLEGKKLIIAHYFPFFKGKRTLEALYLEPLFERAMRNNGRVLPAYDGPVTLLIDIKSDAGRTYEALKPLLGKYRPVLSEYDKGRIIYRAVTIVLSGHKPYDMIEREGDRLAFIDADLRKLLCDTCHSAVFAMASCNYHKLLHWHGDGPIPSFERKTLCAFVAVAHRMGVKVRLWASPEKKEVWAALLSCGVDLINTDQLENLKAYLSTHKPLQNDLTGPLPLFY